MVTAVSAMLVANTTFFTPRGGRWNTRFCSEGGTMECRGRTRTSAPKRASAASWSLSCEISFHPGKKTRIAPAGPPLSRCISSARLRKIQWMSSCARSKSTSSGSAWS